MLHAETLKTWEWPGDEARPKQQWIAPTRSRTARESTLMAKLSGGLSALRFLRPWPTAWTQP